MPLPQAGRDSPAPDRSENAGETPKTEKLLARASPPNSEISLKALELNKLMISSLEPRQALSKGGWHAPDSVLKLEHNLNLKRTESVKGGLGPFKLLTQHVHAS